MRIEASDVSFVSAHRSVNATAMIDETLSRPRTSNANFRDTVQLSALAGAALVSEREDLQDLDPKQKLAVLAIEAILGHKLKLSRYRPAAASKATASAASAAEVHRRTELHYEKEQTSFKAQGEVVTSDGRTIQFAVKLTMQREFQSSSTTTGPNKTTDPLVVNYGGGPAQLTGAKVSFDLNSDGNPETISFVAGGSGFLALDGNGDGKVNDGRELFGPQTGHGFAELASYDTDHNGWIDENDPVFAKLRIWSQDGLSTLAQKGIGAINTSSAETPFAIKDRANVLQGDVRGTGIYLSENGTAGTIQQVDLAEG